MCGLFGFFAHPSGKVDLGRLYAMAADTESRGRHAWGVAWIDACGVLHSHKQAGPITGDMRWLPWVADARAIVGHCRYATHGDPRDNANNHPHAAGDAWLAHNGVIRGHERIAREHGVSLETDCDSEVLAKIVAAASGSSVRRVAIAAAAARGSSPLAALAIWRKPARLVAVKANSQALAMGSTVNGFYLASYPTTLPKNAGAVRGNSVVGFRVSNGRAAATVYDLDDVAGGATALRGERRAKWLSDRTYSRNW